MGRVRKLPHWIDEGLQGKHSQWLLWLMESGGAWYSYKNRHANHTSQINQKEEDKHNNKIQVTHI